jgi:hypothetical protein
VTAAGTTNQPIDAPTTTRATSVPNMQVPSRMAAQRTGNHRPERVAPNRQAARAVAAANGSPITEEAISQPSPIAMAYTVQAQKLIAEFSTAGKLTPAARPPSHSRRNCGTLTATASSTVPAPKSCDSASTDGIWTAKIESTTDGPLTADALAPSAPTLVTSASGSSFTQADLQRERRVTVAI